VSTLPESIDLGAEEEARRLWDGALEARGRAPGDLVALCECLDLGLRAAEILVVHRLQPVKDRFPATIGVQLELPDAEVDVYRDAVNAPKGIQFTDVIDLLSDEELECVAPRLHRGWEDRRFSCRRSRATANEVLGVSLDETSRDRMLLLAAYRNRHPSWTPSRPYRSWWSACSRTELRGRASWPVGWSRRASAKCRCLTAGGRGPLESGSVPPGAPHGDAP